jgi:hypothetical protein
VQDKAEGQKSSTRRQFGEVAANYRTILRYPSHVRDHSINQWLMMLARTRFASEVTHRWDVPLAFRAWLERTATPPLNAGMIETLFTGATVEVRDGLRVQNDYSFTVHGALLRGRAL